MKIKIFVETTKVANLEASVNRWLSENEEVRIHHVSQSELETPSRGWVLKLSVFYTGSKGSPPGGMI